MKYRKIVTARKPGPSGLGPDVRQVMPSAIHDIDPFVFLDHYGPFDKPAGWQGVPPHPHAGITTITYILEGSNRHQDSLGNNIVGQAGSLSWMRAGSGIIHAEGYFGDQAISEVSHGIQLWVSLSSEDKFIAPDFQHFEAPDLPMFMHGKTKVKVLAGSLFGKDSIAQGRTPLFLYLLDIPQGDHLSIPLEVDHNCGLYLMSGRVRSDGRELQTTEIAKYELGGDGIHIEALQDSQVVVLGGRPHNEAIVGHASYVMNDHDQIREVMRAYGSGKMGQVTPIGQGSE